MVSHAAIFVIALVVLVKSADALVDYGARLARRMGVSDLVIGLTLTSVGTSVPELASSVSASIQGNSGLIIGNVVGSNIANIGLIVGVAAIIRPFSTDAKMHDRDGFIMLAASIAFFAMVLNNLIGRWEAVAMLALYISYVAFVASSDRDKVDHQFRFFLKFVVSLDPVKPLVRGLKPGARKAKSKREPAEQGAGRQIAVEVAVIVIACVGVVFGARYLVAEASWAARLFGVPESVIGLSLVAVGTSLPELIVAIAAARKGNAGMVIGNVMGSNLANTLLILGVSGCISPIDVAEISVVYTIPIMLFFTLGLLYVVKSGWKVTRWQGVFTLLSYLSFMGLAFWRGWS